MRLADLRIPAAIQAPPNATATATCLLPGCPSLLDFPRSTGRPRLFCIDAHRKRYINRREALLRDLAAIDEDLKGPEVTDRSREATRLKQRRARLEWHLVRYSHDWA
jgi:hypothetical protein